MTPTRRSGLRHLAGGLAFLVIYTTVSWLLRDHPFGLSLFGNATLVWSAGLVLAVIVRRRREWLGCQRLFWDIIGIAMVLWIVGHLGWAYDQLIFDEQSWLKWHTLFSLCAGVGPLIALLAWPHRGPRTELVSPVAMTIAAYWLFAVFIYSYFVLVPSLIPAARPQAQTLMLYAVQANRLLLLAAMIGAVWIGRRTEWRSTYIRLAIGVAIGFFLRIGLSQAISRGDYQVGNLHDLAWIAPWLCYAWAAVEAPASQQAPRDVAHPYEASSVTLLAIPALLVPLVGYGVLNLESVGEPVDSFRLFLTSLTTVVGLGLVTLRLAAQGGELQRADARLQLLAAATEHTGDLILITRADGTFEHANAAFLRGLGYTRRELSSLRFIDLIDPEMHHLRHDIPEEVRVRDVWRGTLRGRRKDGSTFPAACTITALRDTYGRLTHFVGIERDITDDLKLRDQLVHSERLSAIGELIAGVAHEINNPLQTIIGCTELMLDEPVAANRRDLEMVRKEAMRAGQIVRNLLAFARRGAPDRVVVDLNDLVRATVELREYHLRQVNVAFTVRCAPRALPIFVNREEIRQVILNLLLNAEHAIASQSGGGAIVVETFGDVAMQIVEVTDSGPGISPELRGRIFEPFFTTREVGEGTGLGLSISHGLATSHDGTLELMDSPAGARFRLALPAYSEASARLAAAADGGGHVALVVEREAAVRKLIARLLERRGFAVLETETGDGALALALEQQPAIVICDDSVQGMSCADLYRQLTSRRGDLSPRFLFIRGEKAAPLPADLAGVRTLAKPFTASDLEAALLEAGMAAPRVA